jgi:TPP-dependent pyruvate/acetoin dehydrogenase alpha subunit
MLGVDALRVPSGTLNCLCLKGEWDGGVCLSETGPQENPLIPNKKLRQMFVAMTEMRLLDKHVVGLQRGVKARLRLGSTRGQEACRVSMAIDLEAGDLVSDARVGVAMELLAGARVDSLLRHVAALGAGTTSRAVWNGLVGANDSAKQMPWMKEVGDRLRMAMGAALAFKMSKQTNLVVAYALEGEASHRLWREVLPIASALELPVIFVVLPGRPGTKKKSYEAVGLSARSRECGVPGIRVDASDAVALYRVAQESIGRIRGGGGPVLVECVAYRLKKERKTSVVDPLVQMKVFLTGRKICSETWLDRAGDALQKNIDKSEVKIGSRLAR